MTKHDDLEAHGLHGEQLRIRPARSAEARGILEAHRSAVRETAARDYPPDVIEVWGAPVTDERVQALCPGRPAA